MTEALLADNKNYNKSFYDDQMRGSLRSAESVVPLVLDFLPVNSVCDVGCGVGTWLSVFIKHGVKDAVGLDGSYVPTDYIQIPRSAYRPTDLRNPIELKRKFDLAISLEVAEHLPAALAETFVHSLTRLAPVILFSAAIPNQGGQDHINEQWPDYWERLFNVQGYIAVDALRSHIWETDNIEWWYRQNIFFYVREVDLDKYPKLRDASLHDAMPRRVVHPTMLKSQISRPSRLAGIANTLIRKVSAKY
jgi:SAM-dependent methyltransferase